MSKIANVLEIADEKMIGFRLTSYRAWQINRINHTNQINRGSIDLCKLGGRSIRINRGSITKTGGPIDLIDPL